MIIVVAAGPARAQSPDPQDRPEAHAGTPAPAGPSSAPEPVPAIDRLTLSDDMIGAVGWRTIGEQHRLEALAATGNEATHRAALRATDTLGGVGVELTGS